MALAPVLDFIDGILAIITFFDFALVALLSCPLIILLESSLIRRRIPGTRALRESAVMNVTTFILGVGLGFLIESLLYDLFDDLPEWAVIFLLFSLTLILTILVEGLIFKALEPKVQASQIWRTTAIINVASYAMFGISIGLVFLGYDLVDSRRSGGEILFCVAPLLIIAATAVLISEHLATSQTMMKLVFPNRDTEDEAGMRSDHFSPDDNELQASSTIDSIDDDRTSKPLIETPAEQANFWKGRWSTYTLWILMTSVGTTFGFGLSGSIINKLESVGGITWGVLLLSIGIGGMQWLFLRRHIQNAGWWIMATLGGWTFALFVAVRTSVLLDFTPDDLVVEGNIAVIALGILMVSLILGVVTGTSQWLVLRKQVQHSLLWILVSTVGWAVGIIAGSFVGLSLYYMFQQYSIRFSSQLDINPTALILWPVILAGIATGITAGAITGTVLVQMLQPPDSGTSPESEEHITIF